MVESHPTEKSKRWWSTWLALASIGGLGFFLSAFVFVSGGSYPIFWIGLLAVAVSLGSGTAQILGWGNRGALGCSTALFVFLFLLFSFPGLAFLSWILGGGPAG